MKYSLKIKGMTCAACAARIEKSLKKLDNIKEPNVNLTMASASFEADNVNLEEVTKNIEKLGYEVESEKIELNIMGMTCAACSTRIDKQIKKLPGVLSSSVNLTTNKGTFTVIKGVQNEETLISKIKSLGYDAKPVEKDKTVEEDSEDKNIFKKFILAAIFSAPLLLSMFREMFNLNFIPGIFSNYYFQWICATIVQFYCGWRFIRGAYVNLTHFTANMDVLVALGTLSAYFFSVYNLFYGGHIYFESAAVLITLILLGKFLEAKAKAKTKEAITKLLNLVPKKAVVLRYGKEEEIFTDEIVIDDIILVKSGEKIAVDGVVIEGESYVDESMITGESFPVKKGVGDSVIGGTINKNNIFKFRAEKVGKETMLSQIVKIVEEAQRSKAPIQRIADVISGYFVPVVIVIAILTFCYWFFIGDKNNINLSIINMVSVLVIACPCALGLATPTSIMVGSGVAAQNGILFKGGEFLENMHRITSVVLDKTGTITVGMPTVTEIKPINGMDKEKILKYAASIEKYSHHPIASAITENFRGEFFNVEKVKEIPGYGMEGIINGEKVFAVSEKFVKENYDFQSDNNESVGTKVFIIINGKPAGIITIFDEIKPNSKEAIKLLKNNGIKVFMLTGDNEKTAKFIGEKVGIENVIFNLLPQDKVKFVEKLKKEGEVVAMVGDGINDAPALSVADIGIAIGTGTDVAIEAADVTLIKGDLMGVVKAVMLSKAVMRNIKQNLFWALIYNIIGIPVAAAGFLNPMIAGGAMAFSSVSVVSNALRLKTWKFKTLNF